MSTLIEKDTYNDWKVLSITKIKNKYGFRVALNYGDGKKVIQQKSGYQTRREAEMARNNIIAQHAGMADQVPGVPVSVGFWQALDNQLEYDYTHSSALGLK